MVLEEMQVEDCPRLQSQSQRPALPMPMSPKISRQFQRGVQLKACIESYLLWRFWREGWIFNKTLQM